MNKIRGYKSMNLCIAAAEKRGCAGLTGGGQACGAKETSIGWVYVTWYGRFLIPGGEITRKEMAEALYPR